MARKVVLLHYRYSPAVAGVELVLEQHARLLADGGCDVVVIAAEGKSADSRVKMILVPELQGEPGAERPKRPEGQVNQGDAQGDVAALAETLRPWCEWADMVFVHNILTMPFGLTATLALWRLATELPPGRFVNWVHDLAALNPDYASLFSAGPGDGGNSRATLRAEALSLLQRHHERMRVVAISEWRARQYLELTGHAVDAVIPNGVEPGRVLGFSEELGRFVRAQRLLDPTDNDLILFQPTRIVRRKRIELGLHLVAALRERGTRARLLVTAAPDGHNPASAAYHTELLALRRELGVEREVCFVSEFFAVTDRDLAGLYQVSDVLWFPSREEGFGLPLLEGLLHRLPVFCADRPPMNGFGLPGIEFFDPEAPATAVAEQLVRLWAEKGPLFHTRRAVLRRFAWDAVWPALDALLRGSAFSPG